MLKSSSSFQFFGRTITYAQKVSHFVSPITLSRIFIASSICSFCNNHRGHKPQHVCCAVYAQARARHLSTISAPGDASCTANHRASSANFLDDCYFSPSWFEFLFRVFAHLHRVSMRWSSSIASTTAMPAAQACSCREGRGMFAGNSICSEFLLCHHRPDCTPPPSALAIVIISGSDIIMLIREPLARAPFRSAPSSKIITAPFHRHNWANRLDVFFSSHVNAASPCIAQSSRANLVCDAFSSAAISL